MRIGSASWTGRAIEFTDDHAGLGRQLRASAEALGVRLSPVEETRWRELALVTFHALAIVPSVVVGGAIAASGDALNSHAIYVGGGVILVAFTAWACTGLALHLLRYYAVTWQAFRHQETPSVARWPRKSADADFAVQALFAVLIAFAVWA